MLMAGRSFFLILILFSSLIYTNNIILHADASNQALLGRRLSSPSPRSSNWIPINCRRRRGQGIPKCNHNDLATLAAVGRPRRDQHQYTPITGICFL